MSENKLTVWQEENQYLVQRGLDEQSWNTLCNTLYPSNKPESVILAWDYCQSRNLDIMLKPVHLVGMNVKNPKTGKDEWRDIVMPGVGLYRIQASRSGDYAGVLEPDFGEIKVLNYKDYDNNDVSMEYPEWCKYTVEKIVKGNIVKFSAKEYWVENYGTTKTGSPNAMWKKRPRAQLSKCAEAQALRRAWPEVGQQPTAEEMEGKGEIDITPQHSSIDNTIKIQEKTKEETIFERGLAAIKDKKKTASEIIKYTEGQGISLTKEMKTKLKNAEGE